MFITGLGTATPPNKYQQTECWEALRQAKEFSRLDQRAQALLKKVLTGNNGIESRYLALAPLSEAFDLRPDALHARFSRHAPAVATEAADRALASAGLAAEEIDAVLISTCTGYLCPGLTSYVSERLGLRADVLPIDLVGQGCGAALPSLRLSESLLASGRARHVLSICVEICSSAFYLDNDPGVLLSACLFGDGGSAAILSREPVAGKRRLKWVMGETLLSPADRNYLRFEQRDGMLRNILTKQVPELAAKYSERVLKETLFSAGIPREAISCWIFHAGGREVLKAIRERLDFNPDDLKWSADVLREHGNLSSPFVWFVLQAALQGNQPGGYWWMSSFGAGFSSHGAVLDVE